jgi:hypothetical protein
VTITRDVILADAGKAHAGRDAQRIRTFVDAILVQATAVQRELILDPARHIVALTARRVGKTTAVRGRLVRRMLLQRNARCLYIGMTRQSAEELLWIPLKELNDQLGLGAKFNNSSLHMILPSNGSEIRINGADNASDIDKFRGHKFDEVWIDESKSFKPKLLDELLRQVLEPALMDNNGTLGMIGTPGNILSGMFYEVTRNGSQASKPHSEMTKADVAEDKLWSLHRWKLQDNTAKPDLWPKALANKAREGWTDENPIWRREYLGQWVADDADRVYKFKEYTEDGRPWNVWEPEPATEANPFGLPEHGKHYWRFVYGIDLGARDPFALQVLAYADSYPDLLQVYEFSERLELTQMGELLAGMVAKTGHPDGMVCDPAGLGGLAIDFLNQHYGLSIVMADKKNKPDSIEMTNSDFIDGRLKLLKGSKTGAQALDLQWDDTGLKENKAQRNDLLDALIYGRRSAQHRFVDLTALGATSRPEPVQQDDDEQKELERMRQRALAWMGASEEPI